MQAQRLHDPKPFGCGCEATLRAIEHLGYVQIDTINVIERCHHHILFARIPDYERRHLEQAQAVDRTVFEYWTHALSYVPTRDLPFFLPAMKRHRTAPHPRFASVTDAQVHKVMRLIRRHGAQSIRDIDDDVLVEKDHAWASRKPSKRALQKAFFDGQLTISHRTGMLKSYELTKRHFGWSRPPKAATQAQVVTYLLERALRTQGIVSLESICHLDAPGRPAVERRIAALVRQKRLRPVTIEGAERIPHWVAPETLDQDNRWTSDMIHILSPFDPLIIQRKRLRLIFDYEHRFEAYVPKEKRVLGYFALPVMSGDEVVAAIDLKTDRQSCALRIQRWTWIGRSTPRRHKAAIEKALHRFEAFQLAGLT